jgi:hypothetical protein
MRIGTVAKAWGEAGKVGGAGEDGDADGGGAVRWEGGVDGGDDGLALATAGAAGAVSWGGS